MCGIKYQRGKSKTVCQLKLSLVVCLPNRVSSFLVLLPFSLAFS
jgi:hypothetical protein